jgi:hypothetical protein
MRETLSASKFRRPTIGVAAGNPGQSAGDRAFRDGSRPTSAIHGPWVAIAFPSAYTILILDNDSRAYWEILK